MMTPEFTILGGEVAREGDCWVYTESFRTVDESQELHDLVNDGMRDAREAITAASYEIDEAKTDGDHDSVWIYFRESPRAPRVGPPACPADPGVP